MSEVAAFTLFALFLFCCCVCVVTPLLCEYYFETIFPRIPKKAQDEMIDKLKLRGLPASGKGNGGAGGADRRGVDEPNRRPASVKASLSVAFGQRAPNRANAREEGRGRDPSLNQRDDRRDDKNKERYKGQDKERIAVANRSPSQPSYRGQSKERDNGPRRDYGREERDKERYRRTSRSRSPLKSNRHERKSSSPSRRNDKRTLSPCRKQERRSSRERDRERNGRGPSREPRENTSGRDARDVFKESRDRAAVSYDTLKSKYGSSASDEYAERSTRHPPRSEEVYRLGDYRR